MGLSARKPCPGLLDGCSEPSGGQFTVGKTPASKRQWVGGISVPGLSPWMDMGLHIGVLLISQATVGKSHHPLTPEPGL